MVGRPLEGVRVLVVEDEAMIAMLIEAFLGDLGAVHIKTAATLDDAAECIESLTFDVAILDVNLRGQATYPLAEALIERGIPFVFATGYGAAGLPTKLRAVPILQKPFQPEHLARALGEARGTASQSGPESGGGML